jgi:hypothetical protein
MEINEMGKAPLSDVESWILVLAAISKLSGRGGRLSVDATVDSIQRVLKDSYKKDLTRREIEYVLQDLQKRGFIYKKGGLLKDGKSVLYGITPSKITHEAFTVIKIDSERAYVHDGHEGKVYDPPSVEEENPKTTNTGILFLYGVAFGIPVTLLLWLAIYRERVAQQIRNAVLFYPSVLPPTIRLPSLTTNNK